MPAVHGRPVDASDDGEAASRAASLCPDVTRYYVSRKAEYALLAMAACDAERRT